MKLLGYNITKEREPDISPKAIINASVNDLVSQWEVRDDRKSVYDDIDRMARSDEYVAEALDILVSDILPVRNFYDPIISIESKDENLKKKVQGILKQSKIESQLRQIIYSYLKYGNAHAEVIMQGTKFHSIQYIHQTWSIYRNIDNHGMLKDGDPEFATAHKRVNYCAYDQRDDYGQFLAGWYPYQILHWRGVPQSKEGDGIPFLQSARKNWLRLQVLEDAMAVARIVRAYMKMVHYVPVPDEATDDVIQGAINNYKSSMLQKEITSIADSVLKRYNMPNPYTVESDFFVPQSATLNGKIESIDPSNPQLQNLNDLHYALNRLFARLKAPKSRLANEQDVRAKATMIEINTAYASTITGLQVDILIGIVDMVSRALFLNEGIDVFHTDADFRLLLPSPFVKDEESRARIDNLESIVVGNYVKNKVLSRDTSRQLYLGMDEKKSQEEEDKVVGEEDTFPTPTVGLSASQMPSNDAVLDELYHIKKSIGDNGHGECREYQSAFRR